MARLLHDRYLQLDAARACDLVTGEELALDSLTTPNSHPDPGSGSGWELGFDEVLCHGCDGEPRWIVADVRNAAQAVAMTRRAAAGAQRRGYVAISVPNYLRLRDALHDALAERTLLLVGGFAEALPAARAALLDAAARAPRPHVLLTFRTWQRPAGRKTGRYTDQVARQRVDGGAGLQTGLRAAFVVREARASYGMSPRPLEASALRPPAPDLARQLDHVARAGAYARAGRHAAAARLLREAAAALERRGAHELTGVPLTALGRLLLERGRARDADGVLEQAARAAAAAHDERRGIVARVWQASARCDAGRLTEAEGIARAAVMASHGAPEQRWAQAVLLRTLLWQQRDEDAVDPALTLSADQRQALDPAASAYVDHVAVRALLAGGRLFEAGRRAREAVDAAAAADLMARCLALQAHLRVLCTIGDLACARKTFDDLRAAARAAHAPLRVARARLVLHHALRRAGDGRAADLQAACLRRGRSAAPPLLRQAIDEALAGRSRPAAPHDLAAPPPAALAPALVSVVHEEDDDDAAARKVVERVARELRAGRVDLLSCDAGPASVLFSCGGGLATHLGTRVLDAGIVIGPEAHVGGYEVGVPVRLGTRLLAALVARWPLDRTPPAVAAGTMQFAAAIVAARIDSALAAARVRAAASTAVPELVGVSGTMAEVRRAIVRAAAAPFHVLIEGESGVGKELAARAIHQLGPRRERRFCDLNCAALSEELLDAELFGHTRGAFTGAVADRAGLFEAADGGTLFLDEVADLSPRAQAKLLRVLQQQEVRRIGETIARPIDVRLVAAANRDMRAEAAEGRFRRDLLYRLDVIRIHLPPLRERPEDVAALVDHFWRAAAARVGTAATLTHASVAALTRYPWPGNVRELQNVMAALAVAAPPRGRVRAALLPPAIAGATSVTACASPRRGRSSSGGASKWRWRAPPATAARPPRSWACHGRGCSR